MLRHLFDIGACCKNLVATARNDGIDPVLDRKPVEGLGQFRKHRRVQGVVNFGTVQGQNGDGFVRPFVDN